MCNCKVKNFESTVIALLNIASIYFAAHIYRVEKAIFVLSQGGAFAQFFKPHCRVLL